MVPKAFQPALKQSEAETIIMPLKNVNFVKFKPAILLKAGVSPGQRRSAVSRATMGKN